jgi:hypothetical protein
VRTGTSSNFDTFSDVWMAGASARELQDQEADFAVVILLIQKRAPPPG